MNDFQPRLCARLGAVFAVLLCGLLPALAIAAQSGYWQDTPGRALAGVHQVPDHYRPLDLDFTALRNDLQGGIGKSLSLPMPNGGFAEFVLSDSDVMPAELAARYPQIRSFVASDANGRHARIDISPLGLNAMVFEGANVWLVRPVSFGEGREYVSFSRADVAAQAPGFVCGTHTSLDPVIPRPTAPATTTGTIKRNYRAAFAANHNYVAAISGANPPTVALGLAAVVAAVNRVNEVYENDLSIHMSLVPNNDLVIYPDALTDPYSNGGGALNQNTANLNAVIGSANYDIGHVFTTGSGGVAGLGVVCGSGKGRGTTGLSNPAELVSDTFYIDFVAHEVGHQFGGNHTFNNSCSGNREPSAAYEPGSGSTIMGYAGVCSPNLQPHSDPYFHAKSLDEIDQFTDGSGGACAATETNNDAPQIAAFTGGFTIPASTPFALSGVASSTAVGAQLRYGWEQYNLGAQTANINVDPGNGPIIRSFSPTTTGIRTVPNLNNLLNGGSTIGEILPTTTRALNFRLTVFDNVAGGGTSSSQDIAFQVSSAAGPFAVTAPVAAATWDASINATETVSWNVAGTDLAPVSCPAVDIDIYTGGGFGLSTAVLAQGIPNNGSAVVNVPNMQSTTARVRVRCANNIFFALNPGNFTIVGPDLIFADGFEIPDSPAP